MVGKRLVVYTCITGGYDKPAGDVVSRPDVDYVCFTDDADLIGSRDGVWEYRRPVFDEADTILTSRRHKMSPHRLFPEYEYSLWIDGNIVIAQDGFYDRLEELMAAGTQLACLSHPQRDDIYDEAFKVVANGRDTLCNVLRTVSFLRRSGMPRHFGLYETGVMLRRHNDSAVVAFDSLWWEMMGVNARRDQLSHTYCLWKTGVGCDLVIPAGTNVRNHPFFRYVVHDKPYIKDRTLRGLARDSASALRRAVFKAWMAIFLS